MDDVHARLFSRKYEDQEQFIIQDLSDHSKPETSGLWIQVPEEEIDLLSYDYLDREFSVLNCKYIFKLRKLKQHIDELEVWLLKRDLLYAANLLGLIGLKTIKDIHKIKETDL